MKPNFAVRVRKHILDLYFSDEIFYYETLKTAMITYNRALKDGDSVSLWARIEEPESDVNPAIETETWNEYF